MTCFNRYSQIYYHLLVYFYCLFPLTKIQDAGNLSKCPGNRAFPQLAPNQGAENESFSGSCDRSDNDSGLGWDFSTPSAISTCLHHETFFHQHLPVPELPSSDFSLPTSWPHHHPFAQSLENQPQISRIRFLSSPLGSTWSTPQPPSLPQPSMLADHGKGVHDRDSLLLQWVRLSTGQTQLKRRGP